MSGASATEMERVVRQSYGRLIAFLSARSRNLAAAEDALGEAFEAALRTWPEVGAPDNPEGWLLTTARRRLIDRARHEKVRDAAGEELLRAADEAREALAEGAQLPDERLQLMFACAHPAVDQSARAPLIVQTVLGLDAALIAQAFVIPGATMGQRLSRAKARIREAQVPFEVPGEAELPARLEAVLDAIYVAYGRGWLQVSATAGATERDLSEEALELAALLVRTLPSEPEAHGLMALMLHCQARRAARRDARGEYVPLLEQDTARWDARFMAAAERHLQHAARLNRLGRFQLEAAIQSAHAERAQRGAVDWGAVAALYEGLVRIAPTVGALVGRAAAVAEAQGAAAGWRLLEALPEARFDDYQPYWALRGHLQHALGDAEGAERSFRRAADSAADVAEKKYLLDRAGSCRTASG